MNPLTDDEAALLYTVTMQGSAAYPIHKVQSRWMVGPWRDWKGFPTVYKTKKAAVEMFERWKTLALERWATTKGPHEILTAVGIRGT
jgi:hypothetical protein